jgi:hypothetical protein
VAVGNSENPCRVPGVPCPGFGPLEQRMVHAHLPTLEDPDLVEWDRDDEVVPRGPRFDEIRPPLELMADHEDDLPDDRLYHRSVPPITRPCGSPRKGRARTPGSRRR